MKILVAFVICGSASASRFMAVTEGAGSHTDSHQNLDTMSVASLLKLQFSEPLPVVLARAQKTSEAMPLSQAVQSVGHRMSPEVSGLIQQPAALVGSANKATGNVGLGSLQNSAVFDKAMAFLNDEFKSSREKMDIKLFECGFFKVEKEGLLYEVQDTLDTIAEGISNAEGLIEECNGKIAKLNGEITRLSEDLWHHEHECMIVRMDLEAQKAVIEEDLRVIEMIIDTTLKECTPTTMLLVQACVGENGRTSFQLNSADLMKKISSLKTPEAKKAVQTVMYEVFISTNTQLPGAVDLAELGTDDEGADFEGEEGTPSLLQTSSIISGPASPTKNVASESLRGKKCPIGTPPNCPTFLDKLDQMRGEILDALEIKTAELNKHNNWCDEISRELNAEINVLKQALVVANVKLNKAAADLSSLQIDQARETQTKHELCEELRAKYTECYADLKMLERELCGILKIRQAVYNRVKQPAMKPGDATIMIEDCQMGDWIVEACSSTCRDAQGNPGIQLIRRDPIIKWDPTTPEGKYGASCPPNQVTRDCGLNYCPVDCVMDQWSGWGECSKQCGGGSQDRGRAIDTPAQFGGMECPGNSEARTCNNDSCDQDCKLGEWGGWSPCSKSCKWKGGDNIQPGMQFRSKPIAKASVGAGECPLPNGRERLAHQACNDFICPRTVQCVAETDVVMVLDGSGSLYHWGPPGKDANWKNVVLFTKQLIESSKFATIDQFGQVTGGMRYGVVLYSRKAVTVSPLSIDQAGLIVKVEGMKWPRSMTYTGKALLMAKDVFKVGGTKSRQQIMMLVTDGRASIKKKAASAAKEVRDAGIRLIVIPIKNAIRVKKEMCGWASRPCIENMFMTTQFEELISKLKWYLSNICAVMETPTATTTAAAGR